MISNCESATDNVNSCAKNIHLGIQAKQIVLIIIFFYCVIIIVFRNKLQEYY